MIIRQPIPASSDAGHQTASASSALEEGQFSSELKKQMSAGQTQKNDAKPATPENIKKTTDPKAEPADLINPLEVSLLPVDVLAAVTPSLMMPPDVTTADMLIVQGQQAAQPALAVLPHVTADVMATPIASHAVVTLPTDAQPANSLAQANFASELAAKAATQLPVATVGVKSPSAAEAFLHAATLVNDVADGAEQPQPATLTETHTLTNNMPAAPQSESLTRTLHALKNAEPIMTPGAVAQPASVTNSAATAPVSVPAVASGVLQAEVGTPAWQQSLGQQIAVFSRNGVHHAQLRLHPEDLGSLQVSLRINNDQAQVHFVAESHQVRAALESALPNLRTLLQESGIELGQSSVGADTSSSARDTPSGNASGQGKSDIERGDVAISADEEHPTISHVMHYSRGINTFA